MIEILYEDNHLIAVNKKPGDIVQGDRTGDTPLSEYVKQYIKKKYNKKGQVFLGTIHRLDRPTSGIVVFARTSKSLRRMNKLFQENLVSKTYWAVVEKKPPHKNGVLTNNLIKNSKQNKSYISKDKGKIATLKYSILRKLNNYFMLEIKPDTGRHHQIRVQLSNINCCIKGDLKYGSKRSNNNGICLLAKKIKFKHPVKNEIITIEAPTPNEKIWQKKFN